MCIIHKIPSPTSEFCSQKLGGCIINECLSMTDYKTLDFNVQSLSLSLSLSLNNIQGMASSAKYWLNLALLGYQIYCDTYFWHWSN